MTETYVPLLNHQNTFFTGEVSVGDADTSFEIIFDTGSSLTFINSVNCNNWINFNILILIIFEISYIN